MTTLFLGKKYLKPNQCQNKIINIFSPHKRKIKYWVYLCSNSFALNVLYLLNNFVKFGK